MGKKVNECLLKISSWLSYALNQYGCHNIHSQQEYRRKTNEYGGRGGEISKRNPWRLFLSSAENPSISYCSEEVLQQIRVKIPFSALP